MPINDPADVAAPMFESNLHSLPLVYRGKVRDTYAVGADRLLIVTTDRISAFDVIMNEPIPGKGQVLNAMSNFWFARLAEFGPNHLTGIDPAELVAQQERPLVRGRAVVARRLSPLPIEAVVRGYLIGSGYKEYRINGTVSGIALPPNLAMADRLPESIFTPASKAPAGQHDENIDFETMAGRIGGDLAASIRRISLDLYRYAAEHARARDIIIADTKFEFGVDARGQLFLIDEVLTPDSSRFWPCASYRPGISPPSFDKQFVRDYLESLHWNKQPPAPHLPPEIIARTSDNYRKALELLTAG